MVRRADVPTDDTPAYLLVDLGRRDDPASALALAAVRFASGFWQRKDARGRAWHSRALCMMDVRRIVPVLGERACRTAVDNLRSRGALEHVGGARFWLAASPVPPATDDACANIVRVDRLWFGAAAVKAGIRPLDALIAGVLRERFALRAVAYQRLARIVASKPSTVRDAIGRLKRAGFVKVLRRVPRHIPGVGATELPVYAIQLPIAAALAREPDVPVEGRHDVPVAGKHDVPVAGEHDVPVAGRALATAGTEADRPVGHDASVAGPHDVPVAGDDRKRPNPTFPVGQPDVPVAGRPDVPGAVYQETPSRPLDEHPGTYSGAPAVDAAKVRWPSLTFPQRSRLHRLLTEVAAIDGLDRALAIVANSPTAEAAIAAAAERRAGDEAAETTSAQQRVDDSQVEVAAIACRPSATVPRPSPANGGRSPLKHEGSERHSESPEQPRTAGGLPA